MAIPGVGNSIPTGAGINIAAGNGAPEGFVTAMPGSLWIQTDGSYAQLWQKVSGSGNTGWKLLGAFNFVNPAVYLIEQATSKGGSKTGFTLPQPAPTAVVPINNTGVDLIAHWYTDFGVLYDWNPSGGGSIVWYDWSWLWNGTLADEQQRTPSLGFYHGDDPKVLDWQSYWLKQAGVTAVIPVSPDISTSLWTTTTDQNYWVYQLFNNAPSFKGLQYILWGKYTGTSGEITTQWTDLVSNIYLQNSNMYAVRMNGKLYPAIFVFESSTLYTNLGGTAAAHLTFLTSIAALFQAAGYGGVAIFARHPKSETTIDRSALEAAGVLYFAADYSGAGAWTNIAGNAAVPVLSDATTYTALRQSWLPLHEHAEWVVSTAYVVDNVVKRNGWLYICRVNHTSAAADTPGEGKNQATNWFKQGPINREIVAIPTSHYAVAPHPTEGALYFKAQNPSPAEFEKWLDRAIDSVQTSGAAPIVMVYNVSEWAEGGPGLHPNQQDGFGFLEAVQRVLNKGKDRQQMLPGKPIVSDTIQPLFIVAATTIPSQYSRVRLDVDANRTLTATPTIADGIDGQIIELMNVNASFTITLQDRGTLASSGLFLTTATYVMSLWDSIRLQYITSLDGWIEISRSNVL